MLDIKFLRSVIMVAVTLGGAVAYAQDDQLEKGPYDQRYFARTKGSPMAQPLRYKPVVPSVDLQVSSDGSGETSELIILLSDESADKFRTLLSLPSTDSSTTNPAGLERVVVSALNVKNTNFSANFSNPVYATHLLDVERMSDADRIGGAKAKSPRERLERFIVLRYADVAAARTAHEKLKKSPLVIGVSNNIAGLISFIPNDPYFQPGPSGNMTEYQWGLSAMNFPAAWDQVRGHAQVGILEVGYFGTYSGTNLVAHPDLVQNSRPQFMHGAVFDPNSIYNFLNDHATHVSGIVAAQANNGINSGSSTGGVAGGCFDCSLTIFPYNNNTVIAPQSNPTGASNLVNISRALIRASDNGVQIINWSGSFASRFSCPDSTNAACTVMELMALHEMLLSVSSGNYMHTVSTILSPLNWATFYPVLQVGAVENANPSPGVGGGRLIMSSPSAGQGSSEVTLDGVVAPGRSIVSTIKKDSTYYGPAYFCGDSINYDQSGGRFADGYGDGVGTCTGTSMAAPHISALAGLVRSVNPLLTATQVRSIIRQSGNLATNRTVELGYGMPNALSAVNAAVATNSTKLTPLFSFYSADRSDSFYTTVPQEGNAAIDGGLMPRQWLGASAVMGSHGVYFPTYGRNVYPYPNFPREIDFVIGGTPSVEPMAEVWVFSTHNNPKNTNVPLEGVYRMSWKCSDATPYPPSICATQPKHIDTVLVNKSELLYFQWLGYKTDGLQGYVYPKALPQPAGTVQLMRAYNAVRDDHAIFPVTRSSAMQALGYTQITNNSDWLGYVYPNITGYQPAIQ